GTGIRDELLAACDELVTIPQFGAVESLNAAVSAGILFYEAQRQRASVVSQQGSMALELKNPHSVLAAIQARPLDVLDIQVATDAPSPAWSEVIDVARAHAVRVTRGGRPAARDRRG